MRTNIGLTALIPSSFRLVRSAGDAERLELLVRPSRPSCRCPDCGAVSNSVHSRYVRKLNDLPASGRRVRLLVEARRFRCDAPACPRRIFVERFDLAAPWSRRTERLMAPVSKDTLLRQLRRRGSPRFSPPRVIVIDDWARRRNQRYGTIMCDLERRRRIGRMVEDRTSPSHRFLRHRSGQGHRRRTRTARNALVKPPDRASDNETEARQSADVRARQARPARSKAHRRNMIR